MTKKYLKNNKGIVRAVTTDNLQLEKPLLNENYDIEVHNRNMDKIDSAIQEVKGKIDGLELVASNVKMVDGTTVEDTVSENKANIGSLSQLQTSDKSNLVSAINEVFQSANNGKEIIADAIGEPLSAEDTFAAMGSDINGLLSTFKTNMMNNGVTVESGDRFKSLIDKIATMVEEGSGKGIQFAEGSLGDFTLSYSSSKWNLARFSINPGFIPTRIILCFGTVKTGNSGNPMYNIVTDSEYCGSESEILRFGQDDYHMFLYFTNITETSFDIHWKTAGYYKFGEVEWIAVGEGEEDTTLRDSLASILQGAGVNVATEDDMATLITKVDNLINSKARD